MVVKGKELIPKVGRPRKWETVEELEELINLYFDSCFIEEVIEFDDDDNPTVTEWRQVRPFTVTGLAVALNTSRDVLLDYEKDPKLSQFSNTIKKAKQIIENYAEEQLFQKVNVAGVIFSMKNNYKWVDKTEVDQKNTSVVELDIKKLPEGNTYASFVKKMNGKKKEKVKKDNK